VSLGIRPLQEASSDSFDGIANLDACSQCLAELGGGLEAGRTVFLDVGFELNGQGQNLPISAMLLDNQQRPRADASHSTSCAAPAPQLKREWSLLAIFGRANRSYHDISNTWLTHGFLSSCPICPATQSVSVSAAPAAGVTKTA
jgi:hypothetical protein